MNWLTTKPISHRGYFNNPTVPENSLAAFKQSIEKGLPIELDVQLSKDKQVVVFHDYDTLRLCKLDKKVNEQTLEELKALFLFDTKELIPTLAEVLDLIDGQVGLLVELKNEGKAGDLEEQVALVLDGYKGNFSVQSFSPFSVRWFYKNRPHFLRGLIASKFINEDLGGLVKLILSKLWFRPYVKPNYIAYNFKDLDTTLATKLKKKKLPLIAWTITNPSEAKVAKILFDNIIFEQYDPS